MADDKILDVNIPQKSHDDAEPEDTLLSGSAIESNSMDDFSDDTDTASATLGEKGTQNGRAEKKPVDRGSDVYLSTHPRLGSVVSAVLLSMIGLLATVGVFYVGVFTLTGQYFDSWMWSDMSARFPSVEGFMPRLFTDSIWIIAVSVAMIALAMLFAIFRKRFYTFGIITVYVVLAFGIAFVSKRVLPRPVLDPLIPDPANSAPSGHTALTMIAGVALVMAVPRILRAVTALLATAYTTAVAIMVIYDGWHRPTDSLTAIMLAGSLGLLALAFTRASGMDEIGKRKSSVSVQIVATALIVLGLSAAAYGTYIVSQMYDIVQYMPDALSVSGIYATIALISGMSAFMYGCILALRQATAAPLTRLGLLGAPPVPPKNFEAS
ncbi:phosphatase PAP2 family protein [Alloscardovia criceti]|uniref:phosphatase PAP2 family protein n=1 Tax=Alloscardovia criceti TaxID=356828 RepID=UPI00037AB422|nr:phosphatase PAP2 family protein [Alloscardovia criceti]